MSTTRQITLTENPDGRWTAYDTATQTVTQGPTRNDALDKLDEAVEQSDEQPPEIDSDDPLFSADPIMSVDMGDETIDDVLYGPVADADSDASDQER